jgi:hypothetical protein
MENAFKKAFTARTFRIPSSEMKKRQKDNPQMGAQFLTGFTTARVAETTQSRLTAPDLLATARIVWSFRQLPTSRLATYSPRADKHERSLEGRVRLVVLWLRDSSAFTLGLGSPRSGAGVAVGRTCG